MLHNTRAGAKTEETKCDSTVFSLPDSACPRMSVCVNVCVPWLDLDATVAAIYDGWALNTA